MQVHHFEASAYVEDPLLEGTLSEVDSQDSATYKPLKKSGKRELIK